MFKKVKIIASTLFLSIIALVANRASADVVGGISTSLPSNTLTSYITIAINTAIWAAGLLSVIFIIIGGFLYITAGTSKDGVTKAKNTLLYAIIGLVIVLLALVIRNFVLNQFGLQANIGTISQ